MEVCCQGELGLEAAIEAEVFILAGHHPEEVYCVV